MRKKLSFIVISICLAVAVGACSSSTENVTEESDTAAVQEVSEEVSDHNTAAVPETIEIDAVALITEIAQSGEFEEKTISQLKQLKEKKFRNAWEEVLYTEVFEGYDWNDSVSGKMTNLCNLYKEVCGNTDDIDSLISKQQELDTYEQQIDEVNQNYSFDIHGVEMQSNSFYVTQRLEQGYEDNILGMIQKEIDSYIEEDSSNWVAYNVGEFNLPGDERYIIHSDELDPFSEAGVYDITYIDLGETLSVTDVNGFTAEEPVFLMLSNPVDLSYDLRVLYNSEDEQNRIMDEIIMDIMGEFEENHDETNNTEVLNETEESEDGTYILEDSDIRYVTEDEVASLSPEEIRLAKNEIYARHGRIFDSEDLQEYFESQSWYYGEIAPEDFDESVLNEYERANIDLLVSYE